MTIGELVELDPVKSEVFPDIERGTIRRFLINDGIGWMRQNYGRFSATISVLGEQDTVEIEAPSEGSILKTPLVAQNDAYMVIVYTDWVNGEFVGRTQLIEPLSKKSITLEDIMYGNTSRERDLIVLAGNQIMTLHGGELKSQEHFDLKRCKLYYVSTMTASPEGVLFFGLYEVGENNYPFIAEHKEGKTTGLAADSPNKHAVPTLFRGRPSFEGEFSNPCNMAADDSMIYVAFDQTGIAVLKDGGFEKTDLPEPRAIIGDGKHVYMTTKDQKLLTIRAGEVVAENRISPEASSLDQTTDTVYCGHQDFQRFQKPE